MTDSAAVLIPARRHSTRLPEKLLLAETGQPLLLHTCEQAAQAVGKDNVHVCADDESLVAIATQAGYQAHMTSVDHQSGTDRIAEVAKQLKHQHIINVQADEPEIDPAHIQLVGSLLHAHDWAGMATLATPGDNTTSSDPNQVKVVIGAGQRALYFSRSAIPFDRDQGKPSTTCLRHLGIYAYKREILLGYKQLPSSPLEDLEKLEQLRALEAGISIACAVVENAVAGVDVRSDYDAFIERHRKQAETN